MYRTTLSLKKILTALPVPATDNSSAIIYTINADPSHLCKLSSCKLNCKSFHSSLLTFDVPLSIGVNAKVLLDCGSTTNFISKRFVTYHNIPTVDIPNSQVVKLADGT